MIQRLSGSENVGSICVNRSFMVACARCLPCCIYSQDQKETIVNLYHRTAVKRESDICFSSIHYILSNLASEMYNDWYMTYK